MDHIISTEIQSKGGTDPGAPNIEKASKESGNEPDKLEYEVLLHMRPLDPKQAVLAFPLHPGGVLSSAHQVPDNPLDFHEIPPAPDIQADNSPRALLEDTELKTAVILDLGYLIILFDIL